MAMKPRRTTKTMMRGGKAKKTMMRGGGKVKPPKKMTLVVRPGAKSKTRK